MIDLARWMLAAVVFSMMAFLPVACSSTDTPLQTDKPPQIAVGTSKADVLERLGQPDEREIIVQRIYCLVRAHLTEHNLKLITTKNLYFIQFASSGP